MAVPESHPAVFSEAATEVHAHDPLRRCIQSLSRSPEVVIFYLWNPANSRLCAFVECSAGVGGAAPNVFIDRKVPRLSAETSLAVSHRIKPFYNVAQEAKIIRLA